ncbi:E3 ubiquitin-protein ligase SIRP1-like [Thrips palmi]|uniref:E3 ubiquitin-protein ligase SIRP1-like n=1 Tax=Thrips palmi TaxID=161013 RepID=A0A6P8ZV64_THRPL|nr:E3 ubiquitin-protein ligase SIRP1-like [Thrips palmi]
MPQDSGPSRRRIVRALHLHLNISTPAGFLRASGMLRALFNDAQQDAPAAQAQPPPRAAPAPLVPEVNRPYCSICRSFSADSELPCSHKFCAECVRPWIRRHHTCAEAGFFSDVDFS